MREQDRSIVLIRQSLEAGVDSGSLLPTAWQAIGLDALASSPIALGSTRLGTEWWLFAQHEPRNGKSRA
jgi:hypothetical protein